MGRAVNAEGEECENQMEMCALLREKQLVRDVEGGLGWGVDCLLWLVASSRRWADDKQPSHNSGAIEIRACGGIESDGQPTVTDPGS